MNGVKLISCKSVFSNFGIHEKTRYINHVVITGTVRWNVWNIIVYTRTFVNTKIRTGVGLNSVGKQSYIKCFSLLTMHEYGYSVYTL